jgi:ribokinase
MERYDFIAIGDIVTDAFVRLKEATISSDASGERRKLSMAFGDKIPYEFVEVVKAVGNSPNAAVSAARLGLKTAMVTDVGDDHHGSECLATLKKNGVAVEHVRAHRSMETNYHYVLWYEDDRTILVKHQEYTYSFPDIGNPRWVYVSSLAQNSLSYHEEIVKYLEAHPEVKVAFQPGTFQMKLGTEKLKGLYKRTEAFFCNVEEAKRILGIIEDMPVAEIMKRLAALGPKIVVVTDGPKGAFCFDGNESWFMPPYPDEKPPYERTGAGDAFASTFTAALALGLPVTEALRWGPINSSSVVQFIGAQRGLLDRATLEAKLAAAPDSYRAHPLE